MDKIDTMGMSMPSNTSDSNSNTIDTDIIYKPMKVKEIRMFNEIEVKELREIMRGVLDEYLERKWTR
tara:strand:+ start:1358 stop:1558 length:201 start_codon:yes stop_codon:yes gene_type:complete